MRNIYLRHLVDWRGDAVDDQRGQLVETVIDVTRGRLLL